MGRFEGKRALVTGAASGIGEATVALLVAEGATVAGVDVDADGLARLAMDRSVHVGLADVADAVQVDRAFEEAIGAYGGLDLVVHAAGVDGDPALKTRVVEHRLRADPSQGFDGVSVMSDSEWRSVVSVNLDGTFHVMRAALRSMTPQRSGAVVTLLSTAALRGTFGFAHYAAAKAGSRILMQAAALEAISYGVRVNAVAPGPTDTPMLRRTPAAVVAAGGAPPIGRQAHPSEMAAAIAFLLSDEASYIVGETLNVNGGTLTY